MISSTTSSDILQSGSAGPAHRVSQVPSAEAELPCVRADDVTLVSGRINPAWVLSGEPRPRGMALVSTRDGNATTNFWECTAGRFEWHYSWDETVLILEGEVRITDAKGTVTLRAGDVAQFNAGSAYLWEVDRYVKKIAFHHRPARSGLATLFNYSHRIPALVSVLALTVFRFIRR